MRKNGYKGVIMQTLLKELEEIERKKAEIEYQIYIIKKYDLGIDN